MNNPKNSRKLENARIYSAAGAVLLLVMVLVLVKTAFADVKPIPEVYVRKSNRDPFMPPRVEKEKTLQKVEKKLENAKPVKKPEEQEKPKKEAPPKTMPTIVRYETGLEVTGIIRSNGAYWGIITGKDGRSVLVRQGQKLGDWTVKSITSDTVTITSGNHVDVLKLRAEKAPDSVKIP